MPVAIEPLTLLKDARGWVFEPLTAEDIQAQQNIHVVLTVPGAVRANHYHLNGTEVMIVVGPALVRLREDGVVRDISVPEEEAYRLTIPPLVSHAILNTGKSPAILVAFNSIQHDPANPDLRYDTLIPTSP